MTSTRLTAIASEIQGLIEDMDTDGGYYLDWAEGTANEPDAALRTGDVSYEIRYRSEDVSDTYGMYGMADAEFTIEVVPVISASTSVKPKYSADAFCDMALSDLKSLFLENVTGALPLSGEAVITYKSSSREDMKRGNTYKPTKLITKWNVFYHNS